MTKKIYDYQTSNISKASRIEEEQLLKEMRRLIEVKGLDVQIQDNRPQEAKEVMKDLLDKSIVYACPSCIACTCMICW